MGAEQCPEQQPTPKQPSEELEWYLNQTTWEELFLFEEALNRSGALAQLEEVGILPVANSPNPHNYHDESEAHENWWQEHPEKRSGFLEDSQRRREILRHLYIAIHYGITSPLFEAAKSKYEVNKSGDNVKIGVSLIPDSTKDQVEYDIPLLWTSNVFGISISGDWGHIPSNDYATSSNAPNLDTTHQPMGTKNRPPDRFALPGRQDESE